MGSEDGKYDYDVYRHRDDGEGEYSIVVQLPDGTIPLKEELNLTDIDIRITLGKRPFFKMLVSPWNTNENKQGAGYQFLNAFIASHPYLKGCEVFKKDLWWNLNTKRKSLSLTEEQVKQLAKDAVIALKEFSPLKVSDKTKVKIDELMNTIGLSLSTEAHQEESVEGEKLIKVSGFSFLHNATTQDDEIVNLTKEFKKT